jgi:hypothetical protein
MIGLVRSNPPQKPKGGGGFLVSLLALGGVGYVTVSHFYPMRSRPLPNIPALANGSFIEVANRRGFQSDAEMLKALDEAKKIDTSNQELGWLLGCRYKDGTLLEKGKVFSRLTSEVGVTYASTIENLIPETSDGRLFYIEEVRECPKHIKLVEPEYFPAITDKFQSATYYAKHCYIGRSLSQPRCQNKKF